MYFNFIDKYLFEKKAFYNKRWYEKEELYIARFLF